MDDINNHMLLNRNNIIFAAAALLLIAAIAVVAFLPVDAISGAIVTIPGSGTLDR